MVIQSDVYTIILLTIIIGIAIVVLSKKIDALDPLEKPKGIYAAVFAGVEMVSNTVTTNTGKDNAAKLTPYILVLWVYIFISNTCSLFGLYISISQCYHLYSYLLYLYKIILANLAIYL